MKFYKYLTDWEFELIPNEYYDFSKGKIFKINGITYLAIFASWLNVKNNLIIYAVFEWKEQDFNDKENCIKNANNIAHSILSFATNTINYASNSVMSFAQKKKIQSIFDTKQCFPFPNLCATADGLKISMEETSNLKGEHAWTIIVQNKNIATFCDKKSANIVFNGLVNSVFQYIKIWIKSMQ